MKQFEYCVYIGRFQPFHLGHYALLKEAFNQAEKVIITIGSHNLARDTRNPWTSAEREAIITSTLSEEERSRVQFIYVRDYFYLNNMWLADVQQQIAEVTDSCDDSKICNIGAVNDFPQWHFIEMKHNKDFKRATKIRELYFTHDVLYKNCVLPQVAEYLESFKKTENFRNLKGSFDYLTDYISRWVGAPNPPTFVTVDSIVVRSGHVLVVRRKGALGKGLIALPGGFLNQREQAREGALRELKEETGIKVSKEDLAGAIVGKDIFDHPDRSLRGRTITHGFFIDLGRGPLPHVKGDDDADKAWWMKLNDLALNEDQFFEDHFHIINYFVGSPFMK